MMIQVKMRMSRGEKRGNNTYESYTTEGLSKNNLKSNFPYYGLLGPTQGTSEDLTLEPHYVKNIRL